ncbi:MAG: response regulator transcription factor [Proteobacteria bacterium]|nr:response regulator transcription factor [Pseudomonadota bacterium]
MNRIRTLIAEDEPLAAEGLAEWVEQLPQLELVATCGDGASALDAIRRLQPGLVLMDIHMPGMTGLQVLRALADDPDVAAPAVIFTTAYDEHALTAFELHAADYLLKPYTHERFVEAVDHALQAPRGQALPALEAVQGDEPAGAAEPLSRILVRDQGKIFPLVVDAIEYLRSDTKYTAIVSKGRSYLVRLPIAAFEKRLDPGRFLKVNRACIVNLDFVEAMTPDDSSQLVVQLADGTRITASREVSKQLRADSI